MGRLGEKEAIKMGNAGPWTRKRDAERAKKALEKKYGVKARGKSSLEDWITATGKTTKKKVYRVYWVFEHNGE